MVITSAWMTLSRINKVLRNAKRNGFSGSELALSELLELCKRVVCSNHRSFHLLEKDNSLLQMSLRLSGHSISI